MYTYTTKSTPCKSSSTGDTCATGCCLSSSGGFTSTVSECTSSGMCSSGSIVVSRSTFSPCILDQYQNLCRGLCCGMYQFPQFGMSSTVCEKQYKCNGYYPPALYQEATTQNIQDFYKIGRGGVSQAAGIIIGVNLSIIVVLILLFVLLCVHWRRFNIEKEAQQNRKAAATMNPVPAPMIYDLNPLQAELYNLPPNYAAQPAIRKDELVTQ